MFQLDPEELTDILNQEQAYIDKLIGDWGDVPSDTAMNYLRLGKRTELLGYLQKKKSQEAHREETHIHRETKK